MYNILDTIFKSWDRPITESNGYKLLDAPKGQLLVVNVVGIEEKDLKVEIVGKTLRVTGKTELKEIDYTTQTNFSVQIIPEKLDSIDYTLKNGYLYIYLNVKEKDIPNIKINYIK